MRVQLAQRELLRMLQTVMEAVPSRPALPVLSMILANVEKGRCTLSATDLEVSITTSRPCDSLEEGSATFPARTVYEIVRELAPGEVMLATGSGRFTLASANGDYSLPTMPAEEFPRVPTSVAGGTFVVEGDLLKRMVERVAFAVCTDQTRRTLSGVNWRVGPSGTTMVATDTHRLAKITVHLPGLLAEPVQVIVPPRVLQGAVRLLRDDDPLERVTIGLHQIHFSYAQADMVARLIEGAYADVDAVIPKDNGRHLVVSSGTFLPAVRRVQVLASQHSHQVRLALRTGSVELTTLNRETGAEAREQIEATYDDKPMEIGYNGDYLQEVLANMDAERVRFRLREATSAAIIEPAEPHDREEYFCLLMPLRLAG